ncbi:hypothetical protein Tco_1123598 [Tanacetum coccineum]|uniref:Uncharacterized protein n=1 Tax=Tanacetum coccineum TaxID=301880 RepID=A0ABQ5J6K8_9ASTR
MYPPTKYPSQPMLELLNYLLCISLDLVSEPWVSVGIKILLNAASITAALIDVNAAQSKLVLLENFNENYSKCLRLLELDLLKWDQQVVSELVALRNFARRYGSRFCTYGGCI